jgi:hypothetical protein
MRKRFLRVGDYIETASAFFRRAANGFKESGPDMEIMRAGIRIHPDYSADAVRIGGCAGDARQPG